MDVQEAVQACCSRLGRPLGSAELQLVCCHATTCATMACSSTRMAPRRVLILNLFTLCHIHGVDAFLMAIVWCWSCRHCHFTNAKVLSQIERLESNWYSTAADIIQMSEVISYAFSSIWSPSIKAWHDGHSALQVSYVLKDPNPTTPV